MHAKVKTRTKHDMRTIVKGAVRAQGIKPVTEYPVRASCVLYFSPGMRRYDWVNCAETAKLIEDALRECKVLQNDSPQFVQYGILGSERDDNARHPYTIYKLDKIL